MKSWLPWTVFASMMLALAAPARSQPADAATLRWPDSPLARRAQALLAAWAGDADAMRTLYREHFDPRALEQTPVEARLERWRMVREREGVFRPLEIVDMEPDQMTVRVENQHGEERLLELRFAPEPPHLLLGLGVMAQGPHGGGEGPRPGGPPLEDPQAWSLLADSLSAAAARDAFSGVVLLARGGRVVGMRGFGLADRAAGREAAPGQRFNMASLGKLWTRAAIGRLAATGRLSLDDKVSRHLRGIAWGDSVTLEQLLEHRGGTGDIFGPGFEARRERLLSNADWMADIRGRVLEFAPGSRERYSNAGYVVLGEVVAAVSGMPYEAYLAREVFAPAGMTSAGFPLASQRGDSTAHGYTRSGGHERPDRSAPLVDHAFTRPARGSAAGGGYCSAPDLHRLDRALAEARLLPRAWAAWVIGGPRPDRGGNEDPAAAQFAYAGGAPGVATRWVRDGERLLIVLANRDPHEVGDLLMFAESVLTRMRP